MIYSYKKKYFYIRERLIDIYRELISYLKDCYTHWSVIFLSFKTLLRFQ